MKLKNIMLLAALASIGFASCGDDDSTEECTSLECQLDEMCDLQCEYRALDERQDNGEDVEDEMDRVSKEGEAMYNKLLEKYGPDSDASDEDKEAFMNAMRDCDCE